MSSAGLRAAESLFHRQGALRNNGIQINGGERATHELGLNKAPSAKHEYGEKALTLELVNSLDEAVDHIHENGSSHTECVVTGANMLRTLETCRSYTSLVRSIIS